MCELGGIVKTSGFTKVVCEKLVILLNLKVSSGTPREQALPRNQKPPEIATSEPRLLQCTSCTLPKKLRAEKLRADFSFPIN